MILLLAACGGPVGGGPIVPLDSGTGTGPTSFPDLGPDLVVTDSHVHSYDASWRFPEIEIRSEIEIFVDWAGIVADAHGRERAPDSFDTAVLFEVPGSVSQLTEDLAVDALATDGRWEASIAGVSALALADLGGFDPAAQLVEDDGRTWLLALCDDDGGRLDLRDGIALAPTAGQPGTRVSIPNGGAAYTWLAQIDGDVLRTEAGFDAYSVDWSAVTTDGYGEAFAAARGDQLFVGRWNDVQEADDLGSRLLDLEATAVGWWTAEVAGRTSADLGELSGAGGAFPGFDADGLYLVGVACTTCLGPAPLWLAAVDVR